MGQLSLIVIASLCVAWFVELGAMAQRANAQIIEVRERYVSAWDDSYDVDSPAIWHGPQGQNWIVATSKKKHVLLVFDAETGKELKTVGNRGSGLGEFNRPNGIAVSDDLLFVVERDNQRVQVLTLPEMKSLGEFAMGKLVQPYGISVNAFGEGHYKIFITDNDAAGARILEYALHRKPRGMAAELVRTFGDAHGPGNLRKVESVLADPAGQVLLIADELSKDVKVYTQNGKFTGTVLGKGLFKGEPEGIALYGCPNGSGYWILTDQNLTAETNIFHVFDRESFNYIGGFHGNRVTNTDGITLTTRSFPGFPDGGMFAIDNDGGISAFDWVDVTGRLQMMSECRQ